MALFDTNLQCVNYGMFELMLRYHSTMC